MTWQFVAIIIGFMAVCCVGMLCEAKKHVADRTLEIGQLQVHAAQMAAEAREAYQNTAANR